MQGSDLPMDFHSNLLGLILSIDDISEVRYNYDGGDKMTINEMIKAKGMSKYSLSKTRGIPWATLSDICSGKTSLARCNAQTIQKLSCAFEMTIEEVLALTVDNPENQKSGKPQERSYLETNLSAHLKKAILDYVDGENNRVSYMDCLWGELYGSINTDLWAGVISEEQANYLRTKYLYGEEPEERND